MGTIMAEMTGISGGADYWDNLFNTGDTPWDIGRASPPLTTYIDTLTNKDMSILIPGCGNAYEAEYLITRGFKRITLIDISPVLTRRLEQKFEANLFRQLRIITGDFFALQEDFDCILEQSFLCALDPALRPAYARKMQALLHPGGRLAGVLFNREFEEPGPPFGGSIDEYSRLFAPFFRIIQLEPCHNSVKPRAGTECFFELERNS